MTAVTTKSIPELRKALVAEVRARLAVDPEVAAAKAKLSFPFSTLDEAAGVITLAADIGTVKVDSAGQLEFPKSALEVRAKNLPAAFYYAYREGAYATLARALHTDANRVAFSLQAAELFSQLVAMGEDETKLQNYLRCKCTPSGKLPQGVLHAGLKFQREIYQLLQAKCPAARDFLGKIHWMGSVKGFYLNRIQKLLRYRDVLDQLRREEPKFFPTIVASFIYADETDCERIAKAPNSFQEWLGPWRELYEPETIAWLRTLSTPVVSGLFGSGLGFQLNEMAKANIQVRSHPKRWNRVFHLGQVLVTHLKYWGQFSGATPLSGMDLLKEYETTIANRDCLTVRQAHDAFTTRLEVLGARLAGLEYPQHIHHKFAELPQELKQIAVDCAGRELFTATPLETLDACEQWSENVVSERDFLVSDPELVEIIKDLYRQSPAGHKQAKAEAKAAAANPKSKERRAKRYVKDLMDRLESKPPAVA